MKIFPAIDLVEGKAVRLLKGDYEQMTVFSENPVDVIRDFENCGAGCVHIVDLEGAKDGETPNLDTIRAIREATDLFIEVGGGIRSMETIKIYLEMGIDRVILGTAAVKDESLLKKALRVYGDRVAVGVDLKDGFVAIKGWTEKSCFTGETFCRKMENLGVKTIICTDISRDGVMKGTNLELYRELSEKFSLQVIASGGVSSMEDVKALAETGLYGAIIGKAYYTGAIDLKEAVEVEG